MAVVKAGIAGFDAVETAIEPGRFDSYLGDQVASEVCLKIARICRSRCGEEM